MLQAGRSSLPQRRLELDAEARCRDGRSRRAILLCSYENWKRTRNTVETTNSAGETLHRFSSLHPEIKNHCTLDGVSEQNLALICKFGPEIKNRCTNEGINGEKLASIPKFGPEIKNRCTLEGLNGEKHASILKFGLEIKNRCTLEDVNREKLASILKSGLEIKNRCTQEGLKGEILASALDRQWRQKRVLMRPEAAFPYVFAAEGAQHPPISRHAQQSAATAADETSRHSQRPSPQHSPTSRSTKKEDDRGHPPVVLLESARIGPPG